MNRQQRAELAQETLSILQSGTYLSPQGSQLSIAEELASSCKGTVLYRPAELDAMLREVEARPGSGATTLGVSNATTLEAGRALVQKYDHVVCLNFASAKNPGGGFLSGSQAQEESLARASGLYASLQTQPAFYEFHRSGTSSLYSDHTIFSPQVPIFRDDSGQILASGWKCSFITAAAVNAGAVRQNEPARAKEIVPCMERRTRMVLSVAILSGCQALVLGAWGCGVFKNEPAVVAGIFARVLSEARFQGKLRHIEFAIYDPAADGSTVSAFRQQLNV
jgi:uncharacterized protein (TIGR02452 family)